MKKIPYQPLSLQAFMEKYATAEACLSELDRRRWPEGFVCPRCQGKGGYRLSGLRGYECKHCHKHVSITSGTILSHYKLPLPKLFLGMYFISTNKQGISAKSLAKHLEVSEVTAWHLLHKMRSAMKDRDMSYRISGLIEADEAYVGGIAHGPGTSGRSTKNKVPVLALVEKRGDNLTGYVHLEPLKSLKSKTLMDIIAVHVHPGSTIRTDAWPSYKPLGERGFAHKPEVSLGGHRASKQFALVHRQFANLKSWLLGTHRNSCRRHLDRYIAEYCWRTNRRNRYIKGKSDDREMLLPEAMIQTAASSNVLTWNQVRAQKWETMPSPKKAA